MCFFPFVKKKLLLVYLHFISDEEEILSQRPENMSSIGEFWNSSGHHIYWKSLGF